jgi:hypothetical protein
LLSSPTTSVLITAKSIHWIISEMCIENDLESFNNYEGDDYLVKVYLKIQQ